MGVSSPVVFLGLTSLFTDISSEMVNAVLPLYLTIALQFSPLQFGLVDGVIQGVSAFMRLGGGFISDRWNCHKMVAAGGYGISAVCKLGLLAAGSAWVPNITCLLLDRTGKGIRTAPRDALIALNSSTALLGRAFGVHRALDTVGAFLGPIVAFGLLAYIPGNYSIVFICSFCVAVVGLGVLLFFVEGSEGRETSPRNRKNLCLASVVGLLRRADFLRIRLLGLC